MITLVSRLIGVHRLLVPAFYPYVQRYMQPHQRDVTTILAAAVHADAEVIVPAGSEQHARRPRQHPELATGLRSCHAASTAEMQVGGRVGSVVYVC